MQLRHWSCTRTFVLLLCYSPLSVGVKDLRSCQSALHGNDLPACLISTEEDHSDDYASQSLLQVDHSLLRSTLQDNHNLNCSLCEGSKKWLFVLSSGGRTGSTTIVTMLNSIPGFYISSENREIPKSLFEVDKQMLDMFSDNQFSMPSHYHQAISENSLLCSLQSTMRAVVGGNVDQYAVVGSKEIHLVQPEHLRFWKKLFPCARFIISGRRDSEAQATAQRHTFLWEKQQGRSGVFLADVNHHMQRSLELWGRDQHEHAFHMNLEDFSVKLFNDMLRWLNVQDCEFLEVAHENRHSFSFSMTKVPVRGKCKLAPMLVPSQD